MAMVKPLIKVFLQAIGKELRPYDSPMRTLSRAIERLKTHIAPTSVIDVGVAQGTPELYRHFPTQEYLLIEANPLFQPHLEALQKQLNAKVENVFCGATAGETTFHIYDDPRKSSQFAIGKQRPKESRVIPVEQLDNLVEKHGLPTPYLLKIDVEGAELEVLKGGQTTLQQAQAVIVETSIMPRFHGGAEFGDVVCFMKEAGFVVFDIAGGANHKTMGHLSHVDLIFIPEGAPFRHGSA